MSPRQAEQVLDDAERAVDEVRDQPPAWVAELGGKRAWSLARSDEVLRRELKGAA